MRAQCVQEGWDYSIKYSYLERIIHRLANTKKTTEQTKNALPF